MTVYNAEPLGYSEEAIKEWESNGCNYISGSWEDIDNGESFTDITFLIIRLERRFDESVYLRFPNLKVLISATTGLDHIDLGCLKKYSIKLISLRGQDDFLNTIPSTAEHTWALITSIVRNIPKAYNSVLNASWDRDSFRGYQLFNKTIGIVGYGRLGKKVASYAHAFGMRVVFYDPYIESDHDYASKVNTLEDLVSQSDLVSLHLHLSDTTRNILNKDIISSAKKIPYLINTSRGGLWNEEDVVDALKSNRIKGVATDVLCDEFIDISSNPLWEAMKNGMNVIITPHIGGATWDAMHSCELFTCRLALNSK